MAAAPLPAARQITLPCGTGRRYGAKTTSGCAAATAASKIARRRGRLSVMASRNLRWKTWDAGYPSVSGKRKPPQLLRGPCVGAGEASAPDIGADDVAEQVPPLALEPHQLKLADRGEIIR